MKNLLAIALASVASQTLAEAGPRLVQWQFERYIASFAALRRLVADLTSPDPLLRAANFALRAIDRRALQ